MNNFNNKLLTTASFVALFCLQNFTATAKDPLPNEPNKGISEYFAPSTTQEMSPDSEGFIRRWMLLEPIIKPNRSNAVFTDSYLRKAFATEYFKNQFTVLPKDGDKVKVRVPKKVNEPRDFRQPIDSNAIPATPEYEDMALTWHALDSKLFNVKLFRFATGYSKEVYGVLFWAVTVINCPQEMRNVRMAVGSNSASMWWLNGHEALLLSGDRRMVMDDCVSKRLTLKKGKNIIRGAIINGPGMSDFCIRFLDDNGKPIENITISYK